MHCLPKTNSQFQSKQISAHDLHRNETTYVGKNPINVQSISAKSQNAAITPYTHVNQFNIQ